MEETALFAEFPGLVRLRSTSGLVLKGHVLAQGRWLTMVVCAPHYPDLRQLRISRAGARLPDTTLDLSHCASLYDAVKLFHSSVPPPSDVATVADDDSPVAALRSHVLVVQQLRQVGLDRVASASGDLGCVALTTLDRSARRHEMHLAIAADYPASCPQISADLPVDLAVTWHRGSSLLDLYQRFEEAVDRCQSFWNVLDRLDAELWVLDPERPSRRDVRRRLVISGQLSLEVSVDPLYPAAVPGCRFLGSEGAAAALRERLASHIDSWDEYEDLVDNLERLLGVALVRRGAAPAADGAAISVDCGICYCYRLVRETPERCCDDERCGQPFHVSCLYEWLRSLPSTRQTLRTVFGECPYCGTSISCEIPSG